MERKSILEKVSSCDIMYHILGKTDRSAMPIGNGELAASVWVNKKGEICFSVPERCADRAGQNSETGHVCDSDNAGTVYG